ncbi:MAG: hypothetical protein EP350_06575 [Alphaproteobacteria bacterium]|nr:MAG: hypothetical protein EP350_06575 [Alphaproteobacteria bacterium]
MTGNLTRDERIAAFIDGALEGSELAAFEAELETDSELAGELERLMANDTLLREAFGAPMQVVADDALLARMGLLPDKVEKPVDLDAHRRSARVANDNPPFRTRWALPVGGAIAASLTLAILFIGPGGNSFDRALENTPSGQFAAMDNGSRLTPLLTFVASDGSYCREFSIAREAAAGGAGIACRRSGSWQVEALERGATELADPNEIALASGVEDATLDAVYDRLGASDPFDAKREARLIQQDWSPSKNNLSAVE